MVKATKKTSLLRVISFVMICFLLMGTVAGLVDKSSVVYADEISELNDEINRLKKENDKLNANINNTSAKIKDESQKQQDLQQQISNTEKQITLYNQKIASMENSIAIKGDEIAQKEAEIWDNEEQFAQRVRAMYVSGNSSVLTTILSAKSFSEFLTRAEILKRISQSDQELIDSLNVQKEELAQKKADMEKQNVELSATKASLTETSNSLAALKEQSKQQQAELEKIQQQYYASKKANEKKIKAQEAEIDKIIAERQGNNSLAPGEYAWPVPASSRITSNYGLRSWGKTQEFHYGIDIGAPKGTAIVAANDGEVIMVKKQNYGYGWYVVVDHGGGHATLYAHTSRIDVKVGDKVKRGQTIAGVGTTGDSTGNHLHFEVRVNGSKKNPINYVKKPA